MRNEWLARFFILALVSAAVAIPAAAWMERSRGIVIHARMAETGGWAPENLTVRAGEPLHLRLTSEDVLHSFAIGRSDQPPIDVKPGEVSEVTLTFDQPGKYTYYCTRWCSVNHWRMRGTIEVTGPPSPAQSVEEPLYLSLGIDIDAAHEAEIIPQIKPSQARVVDLDASLPEEIRSREYYRSHSPEELWIDLRSEPALANIGDQGIWDLVARVWQANSTPEQLVTGQQLYATNCAACHGENGAGYGVFADDLDQSVAVEHAGMPLGEMTQRPSDFTDPSHMLSRSPAALQGKILRGGMGTGMPYWGPIFTDEQTWALVAYLWTFQFETENHP